MKPHGEWHKLAAAARRAPDARDTAAPHGFAARVAALAMAQGRRPAPLFEQFSLRMSLGVLCAASAVAIVAAGTSYHAAFKLFSGNVAPVSSYSSSPSPTGSDSSKSSPAVGIPSSETPGVAPSSSDDPVADLVDMVS